MGDQDYTLSRTTLVTPTDVLRDAELTVSGHKIVGRRTLRHTETGRHRLDLSGHLVYPGLINAHDHLNGTWWPRVAPARPYANVYQWLDDLHKSSVRYDRQRNSVEDVYELGMYRNLISGVTTVADHFYRIDGAEFYTRFPIDVLFNYGRTWTPREPTSWGDDIPTEYNRAVRTGQPYIIHLAEGLDQETMQEMDVLLEASALGRNTLIVHGISLRPKDMQAMARARASLCWCPSSNLYLYEQTADIRALLDAGINVTLGTDSSLSGGLNLFEELRTACHVLTGRSGPFLDGHHVPISVDQDQADDRQWAQWLVESVTTRAANALLCDDHRGRIAPGYDADLLVLPDRGQDAYETLIATRPVDVALLIRGGVPVYGDPSFRPLFERLTPSFTSVLVADPAPGLTDGPCPSDSPHTREDLPVSKVKLIAGGPLALLDRLSDAVGRSVEFPFLPLRSPHESESSQTRR